MIFIRLTNKGTNWCATIPVTNQYHPHTFQFESTDEPTVERVESELCRHMGIARPLREELFVEIAELIEVPGADPRHIQWAQWTFKPAKREPLNPIELPGEQKCGYCGHTYTQHLLGPCCTNETMPPCNCPGFDYGLTAEAKAQQPCDYCGHTRAQHFRGYCSSMSMKTSGPCNCLAFNWTGPRQ